MAKSVKILCIGNSFSEDTTSCVADIAKSLGFSDLVIANLYVGGCPISKHYDNLKNDLPVYRYDRNNGSGWTQTPDFRISDAIKEEKWDWITIQHGSSYGGSYTDEESYKELSELVKGIKLLADEKTEIAFNLTWVGEETYDHCEMLAFDRNQKRYFNAICDITQRLVAPISDIVLVCQTGTAVQNARTTVLKGRLNRDGYHLSLDVGRYLAGLVFLRTLTGVSVDNINWMPQGVGEEDQKLILKSVNMAIKNPYCISEI